jgi:hypothetical protein
MDRTYTIETTPSLIKYATHWKKLKPGDMSADETDDENPGSTKRFIRRCPWWRADTFKRICWKIDDEGEHRKRSSVANRHRCATGPRPLERRYVDVFVRGKAPRNMPENWYRKQYMDSLTEEELFYLDPDVTLLE